MSSEVEARLIRLEEARRVDLEDRKRRQEIIDAHQARMEEELKARRDTVDQRLTSVEEKANEILFELKSYKRAAQVAASLVTAFVGGIVWLWDKIHH